MDWSLILLAILVAAWALREWFRARAAAQASAAPDKQLIDLFQQLQSRQSEMVGQLGQLTQAQEHTRGALDTRIGDVMTHVQKDLKDSREKTEKSLGSLGERLSLIDKAQAELVALSGQVVGLQQILDNKQARGAFGEAQLADIVRDLLPEHFYAFQHTLSNNKRVDCLIKLPNPPGPIGIDSKFPLEAYQKWRNAQTDTEEKDALKQLERDTLHHARDIAEKYMIAGETADAALMFLPSESIFSEIHLRLPSLVEKMRALRVYPASPNNLALILNTVRAIMRDVKMREQAHLIQSEVRHLLGDVERIGSRIGKLRSHFEQANKDIDDIETSRGKIDKRGEKIISIETQTQDETKILP